MLLVESFHDARKSAALRYSIVVLESELWQPRGTRSPLLGTKGLYFDEAAIFGGAFILLAG